MTDDVFDLTDRAVQGLGEHLRSMILALHEFDCGCDSFKVGEDAYYDRAAIHALNAMEREDLLCRRPEHADGCTGVDHA